MCVSDSKDVEMEDCDIIKHYRNLMSSTDASVFESINWKIRNQIQNIIEERFAFPFVPKSIKLSQSLSMKDIE